MKHLLIGAAAVALAVGPLAAQSNGHGKGQADHGPKMNGPSMKAAEHGNAGHKGPSMAPAMNPAKEKRGADKPHPAKDSADRDRPAASHPPDRTRPGKGNGRPEKARADNARDANRPGMKVLRDGRRYYSERDARATFDFAAARRPPIDGCPPGLAKKHNGCRPPGLARQRTYRPEWWGLAGLTGPYAYDDGYLLRLDGGDVAGYVPLLGGALSPGEIWPSAYPSLPVPDYYAHYYDLGPPDSYRYADDVFYRVDPGTSAITSIAGLLTGDQFRIGSPLPAGYDVYNVPYPYRGEYLDGPDARYRYSDGYIYRVDPTTQLVTAPIDLLAGQ
jgi:hypothetical protein